LQRRKGASQDAGGQLPQPAVGALQEFASGWTVALPDAVDHVL
jgi:hypothetical protein